jgi:hypothetical protein
MANNKFIDRVLLRLSLANPRLRCPRTRLHIQIEMQYPSVMSLIEYFLILQPEYRYLWNFCPRPNINQLYNLTNMSQFEKLKNYLTGQKLLTFDEADWLDDAIHETLLDDD